MRFEVVPFETLVGETLTEIIDLTPGKDVVKFKTASGRIFKMLHEQDCCESVSIVDVVGEVSRIIGTPILDAREDSSESPPDNYVDESYHDDLVRWTFYNIFTVRGSVTIRWLGTSNGYYGVSVTFYEYKEDK